MSRPYFNMATLLLGISLTSIVWRKWVVDKRCLCFLHVLTVAVRSASMIRGNWRHYQSVRHVSSCLKTPSSSKTKFLVSASPEPPLPLTASASPLTWIDASGRSNEVMQWCSPDWGSQLHCKHICTHTENYLSCCQVRLEIKYWQVARISFGIKLP